MIDKKLSKTFANEFETVSKKLVETLINESDPFAALAQFDIESYYISQMTPVLESTLGGYGEILRDMIGANAITETEIQALIEFDRATYTSYLKGQAGAVKQELLRGVLGKYSEEELVESLINKSGLRADQVETVINTAINTFSRQVGAVMSENLPQDTKYVYIGPVDDKTRDICLAMIAAGELTRAEIDSKFPGSFVDGGGFNCRHRWEISVQQGQSEMAQARAEIFTRNQQGKWQEPKTELEKRHAA